MEVASRGTNVLCLGLFRSLWVMLLPLGRGMARLPPSHDPPAAHQAPLGLLEAKPRWLQGEEPPPQEPGFLKPAIFWQHKLPSKFVIRAPLELLLVTRADAQTQSYSHPLPCSFTPLHWINNSFLPHPAASPGRSSPFLYFIHFVWENPESLFLAGDLWRNYFYLQNCPEANMPVPVCSSQIIFASMLLFGDLPVLRWSHTLSPTVWTFSWMFSRSLPWVTDLFISQTYF